MAVNLSGSWDNEKLSDVREFVQTQLKKGYVDIESTTVNGEVNITMKKADGSTKTVKFTAAEGPDQEGFILNFKVKAPQKVYGSGHAVAFNYTCSLTYDGEPIIGIAPSIELEAFTVDSQNNPVRSIWSTTTTSVGEVVSVQIPISALEDVNGTILIVGKCQATYQGQLLEKQSQATISIANCSLAFNKSFNLSTQIKGYDSNQSMNDALVEYNGTNPADLLIYVDGEYLNTISNVAGGSTTSIQPSMGDISSNGLHTMQIIAKMDTGAVTEDNEPVYIYSNSLLFDFYKGTTGKHVGIMMTLTTSDVLSSPINSLTINTEQYVNTRILYAASSYNTSDNAYDDNIAVSVLKDSQQVSSLSTTPNETKEYIFRDTSNINYTLKFEVIGSSRIVHINVLSNSSGVMVTSGASINISCAGRNNNENSTIIDTLKFSDSSGNEYIGELKNFTHNDKHGNFIDGWDGECLVLKGATSLEIPYKPFYSFNRNIGYYIEFNIEVNTVLDENAYIISTLDDNGLGGFYLKAEEAGIVTSQDMKVYTPIAPNKKYNIAFMVENYKGESDGNEVDTTLLELFVNGIRTAVLAVGSTSSFNTNGTISMNGLGAVWKFYGIRVYNAALKPFEIYNNYLTTLLDSDEIVRLFTENDILNSTKTDIDYQKLINRGKNVLVIEVGNGEEQCALDSDGRGKLLENCTGTPSEVHVIATKEAFLNPRAQKKQNYLVKSLTYYHEGKLSNDYSFLCGPTLMQVQGTSSTYYSRKNYDIFFTGQKYDKTSSTNKWTSDFDTRVGSQESLSFVQNKATEPRYSMGPNDQGVPCLCLKADYSDSSNLHNTQLTTLINDVWFSLGADYMTPPQHTFDTVHPEVRVGINGHPIDVFVKDGTNYTYIGQYNMNNEKKDSHHVYGFEGTAMNEQLGQAICIEFLENNTTATLFNAGSDFNWETCSNSTDNHGKAIPQLEFRYPSNDWVDATQSQKDAVKRVFTWVKYAYDHHVNSYNETAGQYTSSEFVDHVHEYFNVKNLCAWYLYTEYFLAVDQRSKNMMLASWGATATSGIWYFLPYDSDTCLGVTNDGWLVLPWDSDEDTFNPMDDSHTQYAFMGHDSNLWKLVRHYLFDDTYIKGKSHLNGCTLQEVAKVLRNENPTAHNVFNLETINKYFSRGRNYWADITYNFDSDTKYIAPLTFQTGRGAKSDFAQFIQGARDAHRDWLINKRFHMLDSKYACGFFEMDEKNMKMSKQEGVPAQIIVKAPTKSYVQLVKNTSVIAGRELSPNVEAAISFTSSDLGSNDPFKLVGFSAVESIDFDTASNYIYQDIVFPSGYSKLKKLKIVCTTKTPTYNGEALGDIVKNLPNLRELTLKGFHSGSGNTGPLDLSKNIMLEKVDVDCDKLNEIIMPTSTIRITEFNVGKLNIEVPWEFWDSLNDYYTRTQNSCILVVELTDYNLSYGIYGIDKNIYTVNNKYAVQVIPSKSLYKADSKQEGFFGSMNTSRNVANLKKIIYAKIDSRYIANNINDCLVLLSSFYANTSNLEYVNTKGWRLNTGDFNSTIYGSDTIENIVKSSNLTSYDFSFFTIERTKNNNIPNIFSDYSNLFSNINPDTTYIRYGTGWFGLTVLNNKPTQIALLENLNKQTYDDLAKDIPDISNLTISDANKLLHIGSNFNNNEKFTAETRAKLIAKGWNVAI